MRREQLSEICGTEIDEALYTKLSLYVDILRKWQSAINLISPNTLPFIWERHVADSLQLVPYMVSGRLVDIGSGGGFPGLVLAMACPHSDVHLVDSDRKKIEFLKNVSRETFSPVTTHSMRIEKIAPLNADIITSRACADVAQLFSWAFYHLKKSGICLFLKGRKTADEITEAKKQWRFTLEEYPSKTDENGVLLRIRGLEKKV